MSKLYLISRDGKAINDFIELHGLNKSDIIVTKLVSDLSNATKEDRYVVILPVPLSFQWSFRPKLLEIGMRNVTKYYNRLETSL